MTQAPLHVIIASMIKNGIEGAETCAEIFKPYYRNSFHMASHEHLEAAIVANEGVEQIGEALERYYRMSDHAGPYLEFDRAPEDVKDLDLCMRDAAKALIRKAGGNPDDYNTPPLLPM